MHWAFKLMDGLVYRGLTPQQQPGSYQGGEMMMKSVFWWRKWEYPEETTDLQQVTDETFTFKLMDLSCLRLNKKQEVQTGFSANKDCLFTICCYSMAELPVHGCPHHNHGNDLHVQ